ncbi:TolC family protein [Deinococcus arenicola]|uniref:TolC family protein n=1 Tax=Deinococcus arenicola TaxID=2994950 RepID=A0ABU4DT29_9DEIO|nr:TolC family protein [Deinococcus sp. ZS9-10]MDV6375594.1 TolC family protein [Deinococcus sp. ZS9-10]
MTKRFSLLFLTALLGVGLSGVGQAQTAPPAAPTPPAVSQTSATPVQVQAQPLTLASVLALLQLSPGWQSADLTYSAAQLALDSARIRAGLSLNVGVEGNVGRIPWDTGKWKGSTTLNVSASLNVLPWSPARDALRSAERALSAAAVDLRNSRASLTIEASQAFAGARSAVTTLAQADAQLVLSTRLRAVADEQRTQNLITAEAVLERQAALESAQAGRDRAARGVNLAAAQLTRVLGRPLAIPSDISSLGGLPDLTPGNDLNALLTRALNARPEIARAEVSLADAVAALNSAQRSARLPEVTASVQAGQLSATQEGAGRTVSASLSSKTGVLGAQLSLPLKDTGDAPVGVALSLKGSYALLGGLDRTELGPASQGVQQAQLGLKTAQQAVELDVRTRLSAYQDEVGGLRSLQTAVVRAQTALASTRARVEAGLATPLETAQAELNVTQAQNAVDAQSAAVTLAALQLLQATGDLDPVLLAQVPALPLGVPAPVVAPAASPVAPSATPVTEPTPPTPAPGGQP